MKQTHEHINKQTIPKKYPRLTTYKTQQFQKFILDLRPSKQRQSQRILLDLRPNEKQLFQRIILETIPN